MARLYPAMSREDMMSQIETDQFLRDSKIPLKLGTIDRQGDPMIHPLWYYYDAGKFYLITASSSRKLENIDRDNRVYFCIDTEARPYKGVKGKGILTKVKESDKALEMGKRIITKYMGDIEQPLGIFLIGRLRTGEETLLEIVPRYFSSWDDSKS